MRAWVLPLLLLAALAGAQGISYTVQVVAVSDQDAALALQRQLLLEGFPAYVVRTTTALGDVYRVRVGAFANRDAALVFADAMGDIVGSQPVPALAEAIPQGVMPLAPRLITSVPLEVGEIQVLPWGEWIALRLPPQQGDAPASYRVISDGGVMDFVAWRAAIAEDGSVLRVRNLPLWPDTWRQDPPEIREAYRASLLDFVASGLRFGTDRIQEMEFLLEDSPVPILIVAERIDPLHPDAGDIIGLAAPDQLPPPSYGPSNFLGLDGGVEENPVPILEPLFEFPSAGAEQPEELGGEGWRVFPDGSFLLLEVEGGRAWRGGVGVPLWTNGTYLVTTSADSLLLYDFQLR